MALFLTIVQGPLTGDKYEIFDGLKLGRTKGHIKLNDPKSSTLHAKIELVDGKFILKDQGSKNGIRIGKEKLTAVVLEDGVEFIIGSNHFQIESDGEVIPSSPPEPLAEDVGPTEPTRTSAADTLPPPPKTKVSSVPPQAPAAVEDFDVKEVTSFKPADSPTPEEDFSPEPERLTWSEVLSGWAEENVNRIKSKKRPIAAFDPAVNLVFLRGLQAETTWTLGYGPRVAGPRSIDLPIYEPNAPDPCFEILPTATGIQFKTFHADQVLLNGKSVTTKELKHGDQITILNSLIEVEFVK